MVPFIHQVHNAPLEAGVRPHVLMRCTIMLLLCSLLLGCDQKSPVKSSPRLQRAMKELAAAKTPEERYYALNHVAKESFAVGNIREARKCGEELLALLPQLQGNSNYGNAVQDGNLVLGRIAMREGRLLDAKRYLLQAGKSPGSPQMDSFGPNMSLAKDLLKKAEREVVLEYLELCRKFWTMHDGRLDKWSQEVKEGKIPDFGANLVDG